MQTWQDVSDFLETFPEAKADPSGGREVVRVGKKVVAFPGRNERSRAPDATDDEEFVIIRIDRWEREALLEQDPQTFLVTPHYETYPGVIVRLTTVDQEQLRELLTDAWRLVAPKKLVREWENR
jgi:hypothetical protein